MKSNQKGFSVIEILLVIVVVGLMGTVGWLVYDRQDSKKSEKDASQVTGQKQEMTQEQTSTAGNCDDSFKKISNEKIGLSFCYPKNWKTDITDNEINHIVGNVTLTSPDYKVVGEAYGGSNSGSKVSISVYKINQLGAAYTPVSKILDGTEQNKLVYYDVKAVKIAGKDGAAFISGYEGPRSHTNMFEHEGNLYSIGLEEDLDGPTFNDNQSLYEKIVSSFQLLGN